MIFCYLLIVTFFESFQLQRNYFPVVNQHDTYLSWSMEVGCSARSVRPGPLASLELSSCTRCQIMIARRRVRLTRTYCSGEPHHKSIFKSQTRLATLTPTHTHVTSHFPLSLSHTRTQCHTHTHQTTTRIHSLRPLTPKLTLNVTQYSSHGHWLLLVRPRDVVSSLSSHRGP